MRDVRRIDRITEKLRSAWRAQPDLRLGQLIANLHRDIKCSTFYVEDDITERLLDAALEARK